MKRPAIALSAATALLAIALPHFAEAAIKVPSCAELVKLGQDLKPNEVVPVNQVPSRFALFSVYASPRAEQMFGMKTLDWSQDDLAAVIKATGDCVNEAKKARKAPETQALGVVWQSLGAVRSTLGGIAATEKRLDDLIKALLSAEPSRALMVSTMAVASARPGTAAALTKADQSIRAHSNTVSLWYPAHTMGQNTLTTLRDVPERSWPRYMDAVDKRVPELQRWTVEDVRKTIDAIPDSPDGLRQIPPTLAKIKAELTPWLPATDIAGFETMARMRQDAIEDGIVAKAIALVDATALNADGLNQLRIVQATPARAVLSPDRAKKLDDRIAARRDEIGMAVADQQIKQLDTFPGTIAGLRDLNAYKTTVARNLEALAGPAATQRFRDAATLRATKIGESAFPEFRKALGEVKGTEEGLADFDAALSEIRGAVGGLDANLRSRYLDAAQKRREELVEAVAKENARLAKLPLEGAVYADSGAGAKLEFRARKRVYITMLNMHTVEGEYEVDGDRVIIRTPGSNDVFSRDGGWLRNAMLRLRRQPDK